MRVKGPSGGVHTVPPGNNKAGTRSCISHGESKVCCFPAVFSCWFLKLSFMCTGLFPMASISHAQ